MIKRLINKSVFRRLPEASSMETILSMMFHRLSATLYLVYTIWAGIAIANGIPSLVEANGEEWQVMFSIAVLIFAAPSCFGATFWPSFARLELYAGAGFTTLLAIYIFFLTGNAIFNGGSWAGTVIISSVLVVPACRFIIVIMFLLRQADQRKRNMEGNAGSLLHMPDEDEKHGEE